MKAVALDIGFPGAGRVVRELANISDGKVEYREAWDMSWGADYLFLPAWHPQYETMLSPKKVIVWTSPIIQSEYERIEFEYMKTIIRLLDEGNVYALWLGSRDWLPFVEKKGRRAFYCPYPVTLPPTWKEKPTNNPPKDVSLFGPLGPRKNAAVQAMAAAKAGCTLHITDDRAMRMIGLDMGIPLVSHGWVIPARYHDLVCSVDVGLQCSIPGSESFSYVAWDHVSRDVPCVTTVFWINQISGALYVRSPEAYNVVELADHIAYAADMYDPGQIRKEAERFAEARNTDVKSILKEKLGLFL